MAPLRAPRRSFLTASAAASLAAWIGPAADALCRELDAQAGERLLGLLPFLDEGPFPVETTVGAGLGRRRALDLSTLSDRALLVSQDRFFVRTGRPDALPPAAGWKVRVHGLVEAPAEVTVDELERDAAPRGVHLLECAGNSRAARFGFMSAASWTGEPLEQLLRRARPRPTATQVLVSGFDQHAALDPGSAPGASWIFGLAEARDAGAFLATRMNGAPLTPDHGAPVRLVVPGWYGCTAIKWVNEIALVDDTARATPQMLEFAGRTHQPRAQQRARDFQPATIDPAALPVRVEKIDSGGRTLYRVTGIAWGGPAPLRGLIIRLDPGPGFVPVQRFATAPKTSWALWVHTLQPPAPGRYRIELAVPDGGIRTRRLDAGYYTREVEVRGA
jgi:DMSO/TMAO reductase YedYZ molybdopterin-dependent catalytic subunit